MNSTCGRSPVLGLLEFDSESPRRRVLVALARAGDRDAFRELRTLRAEATRQPVIMHRGPHLGGAWSRCTARIRDQPGNSAPPSSIVVTPLDGTGAAVASAEMPMVEAAGAREVDVSVGA